MYPAIPNKEVLHAVNSSDIGVCFIMKDILIVIFLCK